MRSYFHAAPDGRFDDAARDAALKALVATGLFDNVTIERAGERLVVHLTEAQVLDRVAFEGNKKIKDTDLAAAVQSKPRGTLQRAMVQADVGRIMEAYRHAGRDDVSVVPEIIDRGNDRVDLVYEMTEGAKTTVRQINFVGNHVFGKRQLAAVIKTSATNMLSFLTGGDVYDPDRVAQDREQLRLYYRSKGYADASVPQRQGRIRSRDQGIYADLCDRRRSALPFRRHQRRLQRAGDSIAEKLRRLLVPRPARCSTAARWTRPPKLLAIEMAKLGYPFAQATPRITRDAAAQRIDVAFAIDQGPRTYVERIEIHGNTRTRDYVIRREFDIAEGDAYNKTLIDRAERQLKNLNYFKTVKITTGPARRRTASCSMSRRPTSRPAISTSPAATRRPTACSSRSRSATAIFWHRQERPGRRHYGQYARGIDLSASEPYFLGTRVAAASSSSAGRPMPAPTNPTAADLWRDLQFGTPITEQLACSGAIRSITRTSRSIAGARWQPPSLPIQQAAAAGPMVSAAGRPSPTTRSTTPRARPTASIRNSARTSPASAAT